MTVVGPSLSLAVMTAAPIGTLSLLIVRSELRFAVTVLEPAGEPGIEDYRARYVAMRDALIAASS